MHHLCPSVHHLPVHVSHPSIHHHHLPCICLSVYSSFSVTCHLPVYPSSLSLCHRSCTHRPFYHLSPFQLSVYYVSIYVPTHPSTYPSVESSSVSPVCSSRSKRGLISFLHGTCDNVEIFFVTSGGRCSWTWWVGTKEAGCLSHHHGPRGFVLITPLAARGSWPGHSLSGSDTSRTRTRWLLCLCPTEEDTAL